MGAPVTLRAGRCPAPYGVRWRFLDIPRRGGAVRRPPLSDDRHRPSRFVPSGQGNGKGLSGGGKFRFTFWKKRAMMYLVENGTFRRNKTSRGASFVEYAHFDPYSRSAEICGLMNKNGRLAVQYLNTEVFTKWHRKSSSWRLSCVTPTSL